MKKLLSYIFIFTQVTLFAQNTIQGTVTDAVNNELLPNVYVYIPDLQKGTVTNISGEYELKNLPNGFFKIQYSFLGYKTIIHSLEINKQLLSINISLTPTSIQTQEIIVTGGRAGSQHENAIKIENICKEKLDNAPATNIIQKLSAIPGVDAISNGNSIATPVIRGLSTSNIVVLNNGMRMENYQFSNDHPYSINGGDVSNVEVIKGPASLLYGSDAVGGVLNFIKEPPAPINKTKATVYSSFASNDKGINTGVNFSHSGNNYFGGFSGNIQSAMDYYDGNSIQTPNTRNNSNSIKAFAGYRNSKGIFKLNYDYNKLKLGITNPPAISKISDNKRENSIWFQNLDNHLLALKTHYFLIN